MIKPMRNLRELVEKNGDVDLLREVLGPAAERLMELEVGGQNSAPTAREAVIGGRSAFLPRPGLVGPRRERGAAQSKLVHWACGDGAAVGGSRQPDCCRMPSRTGRSQNYWSVTVCNGRHVTSQLSSPSTLSQFPPLENRRQRHGQFSTVIGQTRSARERSRTSIESAARDGLQSRPVVSFLPSSAKPPCMPRGHIQDLNWLFLRSLPRPKRYRGDRSATDQGFRRYIRLLQSQLPWSQFVRRVMVGQRSSFILAPALSQGDSRP